MLQKIRDNSQGTVAKIVIAIIIVPFALFGIDSLVGGGGASTIATVGGEDITELHLQQEIYLQKRRLLNQMGENADYSLLDDNVLRAPALENLINKQLLVQAAAVRGVAVSPSVVDETILAMPSFQQDGQFSAQLYENILRTNGYSPGLFKKVISEDMLIAHLNNGIGASDFVTEKELDDIAKIIAEKRSFRYLTIPVKGFESGIDISDQQIETYFNENAGDFQTEEQVKLAYIELQRSDFYKDISEEALRAAYDEEMANFSAQEERRVSHILYEITDQRDEEQALLLAQEALKKINQGASFEALAREESEDIGSAEQGGDLGFSTGDTFPPAFEEALADLAEGEVSEAVITEAGVHVIKATEVKSAEKPDFESYKPVLTERLQADTAEEELLTVVENLRDIVFNSEDLSEPAKELSLTVRHSDWVSRTTAEGVLSDNRIIAAAFSEDVLKNGNNSDVFELTKDHFVVVRVEEHKPVAQKSLESVRDNISGILLSLAVTNLAKEKALALETSVKSGAELEKLAEENGYEWHIETDAMRNKLILNLELLRAVFEMPTPVDAGAIEAGHVKLSNNDIAVVKLDSVVAGSLEQFSHQEKANIRKQLQDNASKQGIAGFVESVRKQSEVKVM